MAELEARVEHLSKRLDEAMELIATMQSLQGTRTGIHMGIESEGGNFPMSTFFQSGQMALDSYKVNKLCLRVGNAYGIDRVAKTGLIGMSRGVNGRFLSQVDSLPAGVTVEVES